MIKARPWKIQYMSPEELEGKYEICGATIALHDPYEKEIILSRENFGPIKEKYKNIGLTKKEVDIMFDVPHSIAHEIGHTKFLEQSKAGLFPEENPEEYILSEALATHWAYTAHKNKQRYVLELIRLAAQGRQLGLSEKEVGKILKTAREMVEKVG